MSKEFERQMMMRCLQLAKNGLGTTYPNPMVGCVIVHNQRIIAEAWHQRAGEPHAEVLAIKQVPDKEILSKSTLFVSLEPCAHHGKTPPCSDLIIHHKIPKVIIGTVDPFSQVNGLGVKKMKQAGIEVELSELNKECKEINKRFFTFHQKKRPYVILKWAQTANGYISTKIAKQQWISTRFAKQLTHKWRTEEQAILVGTRTAQIDNPQLNSRLWSGNQPVRVVLDKDLTIDSNFHLWDQNQRTLVFSEKSKKSQPNLEFIQVDFQTNLMQTVLHYLYKNNIQSIIIEGGAITLQSVIDVGMWDEARVFESTQNWEDGIKAPSFIGQLVASKKIASDRLKIYVPS